ncbi:WxL domain-containing protein [Enterococcus mundtii]|uniref:WxL domain-containing protein n=1 Tax=Enterococcus mundtii TaxID=53346 RepID=UPI003219EE9A
MKLVRLATIAALTTTILATGTTAVFAQETREVTTEGKVQFRSSGAGDGDLEVINPETGPEAPEVDIDPIVPGTTGPLSIVMAPTMSFGTQVISNQDQTYNMVAEMANLSDGSGEVPYVSFAQVQDLRGTNAGWDLQVSLSDFESETQNDVLTGAEIELVNSRIQYEGINAENAPESHSAGLKLIPGEGARPVMTANQGKGAGASSVVWGNQQALNQQFADEDFDPENDVVENEAIKLFVPGSTAKDATTYTSTLNWELTTTPGEDA